MGQLVRENPGYKTVNGGKNRSRIAGLMIANEVGIPDELTRARPGRNHAVFQAERDLRDCLVGALEMEEAPVVEPSGAAVRHGGALEFESGALG